MIGTMPAFAESNSGKPKHFRAAGLHREIVERALVRAIADPQWPAEAAFDLPIEHGLRDLVLAPLPEARVTLPVQFQDM
jgi:hypothetical protein